MKIARLLLVLAALAVSAGPPAAHGAHPAGRCSGTFIGSVNTTCEFWLRGIPTYAEVTANVSSGTASVFAQIETTGTTPVPVKIAECRVTGSPTASCRANISTGQFADRGLLTPLTCRIQATGSGSYECKSAAGF